MSAEYSSFVLFAAKYYRSFDPDMSEEFLKDVSKFSQLDKMLSRFEKTGTCNVRLILNYLVILGNVFEINGLKKLLTMKIQNRKALKPFLIYLGYIGEHEWNDVHLHIEITRMLQEETK